jgi:hypothetical protein
MKLKKVRLNDLQYLVGRLLWLTSEWHHLRPLLIPLYRATVCIPVTMVGVDHVTYHEMWQSLDDKLRRATDLSHRHKTLVCHTQVVRVANTNVSSLTALRNVHIKSWRVWLGVQDPSSPWRELDDASSCALQDWRDVFTSTAFSLSLLRPLRLDMTATADAMADEHMAGLGGAVFFPDGSMTWFRLWIPRHKNSSLACQTACRNTLQCGSCLHSSYYQPASTSTCRKPVDLSLVPRVLTTALRMLCLLKALP